MKELLSIFIQISIGTAISMFLFFLINPSIVWHINSPYKTQTILYEHKEKRGTTIQFQMQDSGALGYNRRIVKVEKERFFSTVSVVDTAKIDHRKWFKVDKDINQLGLK